MSQPAAILALRKVLSDTPDLRTLFEEHAPALRVPARQLLGADGDMDDLVLDDVFLVASRKRSAFEHHTAAWSPRSAPSAQGPPSPGPVGTGGLVSEGLGTARPVAPPDH